VGRRRARLHRPRSGRLGPPGCFFGAHCRLPGPARRRRWAATKRPALAAAGRDGANLAHGPGLCDCATVGQEPRAFVPPEPQTGTSCVRPLLPPSARHVCMAPLSSALTSLCACDASLPLLVCPKQTPSMPRARATAPRVMRAMTDAPRCPRHQAPSPDPTPLRLSTRHRCSGGRLLLVPFQRRASPLSPALPSARACRGSAACARLTSRPLPYA
jgi:hypothetical protein